MDKSIQIKEKLKTVSNDPDFILGVLTNSKSDKDRQAIIDYIELGENVTYSSVLLLSLKLDKENKQSTLKKLK